METIEELIKETIEALFEIVKYLNENLKEVEENA